MITSGIDCGAKTAKTVILKDGRIIGKAGITAGFDLEKSIETSLAKAVEAAGIRRDDIEKIHGTGSGKASIIMAVKTINDIQAMARGAAFFFPKARTVVDVGAEETRTARLDAAGNPVDFAVNDKCAAGAGAFIEAMARALETPLEKLGPLALTTDKDVPINAQCAIFAESEVVGLIHSKVPRNEISKAIHDAMAGRVAAMVRRVGIAEDVVVMGGVANNPGFLAALKRLLNLENIHVPDQPEFAAAVGAAITAAE